MREGLVAALGADAERGTEQIFAAVKQALAVGLHEVFLVAALLLVVATAAAAVVKDIPLRTSNRVADDEEPGAATPA